MIHLNKLEVDNSSAEDTIDILFENKCDYIPTFNLYTLMDVLHRYLKCESVKSYTFSYEYALDANIDVYIGKVTIVRNDNNTIRLHLKNKELIDLLYELLINIISFLSTGVQQ